MDTFVRERTNERWNARFDTPRRRKEPRGTNRETARRDANADDATPATPARAVAFRSARRRRRRRRASKMNEMREPERGIRLTNERERVARAQDSPEKRRIERNEGSGKGASVASRAIKVDASTELKGRRRRGRARRERHPSSSNQSPPRVISCVFFERLFFRGS